MWCQIQRFHLRNTLKLARKKKKNVKESATLFFKTTLFFSRSFDLIFHMFKCINQTFHQNRKCSWDKTGEENVVLDYAIYAQKYPKIVKQEKEKFKESPTVVLKLSPFFTES